MEERNPLLPAIELLLLAVFLVHVYKTVRMFLANQARAAGALRAEETCRPPEPQVVASSTMIVSGLWLFRLSHRHVKCSGSARPIRGATAARFATGRKWNPVEPVRAGFYVPDDRRHLASLARHLERTAIARPRPSAMDASRADAGKLFAVAIRRLHRHRSVGYCVRRLHETRRRVPAGSIAEKWDRHKFEMKLQSDPANKRKHHHRRRDGLAGVGRVRRSANWATTS